MKVHEKDKGRLEQLKIDCSKCSGLCCTALFFSKIDGFPENKKAGKPCTNLENNYRCKIHHELEKSNMKGCIGYDCFGADTRDTNFNNSDLREAVFLTQGQINSAKGNRNTKLPKHLDSPVTWK